MNIVIVTAFIEKDDKVLIVKRSENESLFPNKWEMPSGKLEFGEDPNVGLRREVFEEVRLDVNVCSPISVFSYMTEKEGQKRYNIEIVYKVSLNSENKIRLSDAHTEYFWMSEDQVGEYFEDGDEIGKAITQGFAY